MSLSCCQVIDDLCTEDDSPEAEAMFEQFLVSRFCVLLACVRACVRVRARVGVCTCLCVLVFINSFVHYDT